MDLSSSHGEEVRWVLELLWQLPRGQQRHHSRYIPAAENDGFFL
jgi:hypothetical protein